MKNHFKISLLAVAIILQVFSACKKDNEITTKSATDYLTQGNWVMSGATIDPGIDLGDGELITDFFPLMEMCQADNFMTYQSDGTVTQEEGASKCDPADPQVVEGEWTLNNNDQNLTIAIPGSETLVATIASLNDNTMVWNYDYEMPELDGTMITYTYTITWSNN